MLIYLGNNVFGELHKRPYSPFLHRTVDILIVQQLRPVDRESRYDGQPLNLTNPTTLPMTDVEVISIGLPGNTTIITPLIDLCSSADDCQERIWQKTTFDLTGEDDEAVNITEDIANRPHRNSILDQEFPIQFKMGLEEGGCRADVYDSVNLNTEHTRTIGEITFPSLDLEHEMNKLNGIEISQPQASTETPVMEHSYTGTLPVETSQKSPRVCSNDDQETSFYSCNNTLPDETSLSPAAKLSNMELESSDAALPGETITNEKVSDATQLDAMLKDTPQPPQPQTDNTSISPLSETVNTTKTICPLKELCQRILDHDNSENVLSIMNSTQTDAIATLSDDKLNPNIEMTGSEQETMEYENNDSQNSHTPSLSEAEPGIATSNDVGTELPGNTSITIKPKPSTYYTVVNSTLDDIVFISKREILNKKWKVELRNLSTKDLKLLQLSITTKRPVKQVVTQELSMDDIDDKPSKPKRKPRPRLRPSSERIAAQALVNLQRHGVCTNPSPKHTLSVVPIKNSEPITDDNSNTGENKTLPGETSNIENAQDINPVPPKAPSDKKWSDIDTDDANDNYDGDTEDYEVPVENAENTAPLRKSRHKRKRQSSPQTRGNFSMQLHARTPPKKKHKKQKCTKCDFVARHIAELNSHYKRHHSRVKCPLCHMDFATENSLKKHKYNHTLGQRFPCADCNKSYAFKSQLNTHRIQHRRNPSFKCMHKNCGHWSAYEWDLKKHVRTHTTKWRTCKYCDYTYNNKKNYHQHLRVHSEKKPYYCVDCSEQFRYYEQRKQHYNNKLCPNRTETEQENE